MKRLAISTVALTLAALMSAGVGYATDGSGSGTEPVPDPPKLPACNLKDTTYSSGNISISVSETQGVKLEFAVVPMSEGIDAEDWTATTSNTHSINTEGNYNFAYRVTDEATGLTSTSQVYKIYYDRTAPKAPKISYENNIDDQCVYVKINVTGDNGSPLDTIYYRLRKHGDDGGRWYNYKSPIKITTEGYYDVDAYVIDKCGNESAVVTEEVDMDYANLLGVPSVSTNDDNPSKDSITYTVDSYNSKFDYSYKFVRHGSKPGNSDWKSLGRSTAMKIDEEGKWDLYIKVEYGKDYEIDKVATCTIDRTKPEVYKVSITKPSKNSTYSELEISAHDDYSGRLKYSFDKGETWQTSNSKAFRGETKLFIGDIQVKDEAGNVTYALCGFDVKKEKDGSTTRYNIYETNSYLTIDGIHFNDTARNNGYVVGTGGNTFSPDKDITRAEFATMLYRVLSFDKLSSTGGISYNDVKPDHWAYNFIMEIQKYGLIDTSSSRSFKPDEVMTREAVAYTIGQILDTNGLDLSDHGLTDINSSKYKEEIIKANCLGIMDGYGNGVFGPKDALTRAQVVTILNRLISMTDNAKNNGKTYTDVPTNHWAYEFIFEASI